MSTTTKKATGRKPRVKKDTTEESDSPVQETITKQVEPVPQLVALPVQQQAQIEIQNWSNEAKKIDHDDFEVEETPETKVKSVLDFDREEILKLESKTVSELSVLELLKILIRRGEVADPPNPIISGGCERLLKQISRERMNKPQQNFNKEHDNEFKYRRGGYRGFRGGFRGAYRGRGGEQKHFSRNRDQNAPAPGDTQ